MLVTSDGKGVAPLTSVMNVDVKRIKLGQHRAILIGTVRGKMLA